MVLRKSAHSQHASFWLATGDKMLLEEESADNTGRKTCATSAIITSLTSTWWHSYTGFSGITTTEVQR